MSDTEGHRLYVTLSASQVRRRLKGFGHGVRRVEAAGKNQAVILHTATGRNLRELESLFADVRTSRSEDTLGVPVENLRNIGPASAAWLKAVGIHTIADLARLGAAGAYRLVRAKHPEATPTLLWSLAAGLEDKDWRELTAEEKDRLAMEAHK